MRARFNVLISNPKLLLIEDVGYHVKSVTNDVEAVVKSLLRTHLLSVGQRLEYLDSNGHRDAILFDSNGFVAFELNGWKPNASVLPGQSITGAQAPLAFATADQELPDASSGSDQELGAAEDR